MSEWTDNASFQEFRGIVASLHVVNDAAERSVKFGSDYSQVRTKSESHRQNVLQSVELGRRAFPKATKKVFTRLAPLSSIPELMAKIDYDAREDK